MSKKLVWIVPLVIILAILGYAGMKYRQYSAEWRQFDAARQKIDSIVSPGSGYNWAPGVLSAVGEIQLATRNITDAQLTELVTELKPVTSLVILDLSGNPLTDASATHLSQLQYLQQLNLRGTQFSDAGIEQLKAALLNCEVTR